MDDLIAFITARLAEKETAAKAAASVAGPDWTWKTLVPEGHGEPTDYVTSMTGALLLDTMGGIESAAPFVALNDPGHALREVEADRAILARYEALRQPMTLRDRAVFPALAGVVLACIRDRGAVWSDHPDYRPEWKPVA